MVDSGIMVQSDDKDHLCHKVWLAIPSCRRLLTKWVDLACSIATDQLAFCDVGTIEKHKHVTLCLRLILNEQSQFGKNSIQSPFPDSVRLDTCIQYATVMTKSFIETELEIYLGVILYRNERPKMLSYFSEQRFGVLPNVYDITEKSPNPFQRHRGSNRRWNSENCLDAGPLKIRTTRYRLHFEKQTCWWTNHYWSPEPYLISGCEGRQQAGQGENDCTAHIWN